MLQQFARHRLEDMKQRDHHIRRLPEQDAGVLYGAMRILRFVNRNKNFHV